MKVKNLHKLANTLDFTTQIKGLLEGKVKLTDVESCALLFYYQSIGTILQTLAKDFTKEHSELEELCFTENGSWHKQFRLDICHQTSLSSLKSLLGSQKRALAEINTEVVALENAILKIEGIAASKLVSKKPADTKNIVLFGAQKTLSDESSLIFAINSLLQKRNPQCQITDAALLILIQTLGNTINAQFRNYKYEELGNADLSKVQFIEIRNTLAHLRQQETQPHLGFLEVLALTEGYCRRFLSVFAKQIAALSRSPVMVSATSTATTSSSMPPVMVVTESAQENKAGKSKKNKHPKETRQVVKKEKVDALNDDAVLEQAYLEAQARRQATRIDPFVAYRDGLDKVFNFIANLQLAELINELKNNQHLVNVPVEFKLTKAITTTTRRHLGKQQEHTTDEAHEYVVYRNSNLKSEVVHFVAKSKSTPKVFFTPFSYAVQKAMHQFFSKAYFKEGNFEKGIEFLSTLITELRPNLNIMTLGEDGALEPLLHTFIYYRLSESLLKTCVDQGADVNQCDAHGVSALQLSLIIKRKEFSDFLIAYGADFRNQPAMVLNVAERKVALLNPFIAIFDNQEASEDNGYFVGQILSLLMSTIEGQEKLCIWICQAREYMQQFAAHIKGNWVDPTLTGQLLFYIDLTLQTATTLPVHKAVISGQPSKLSTAFTILSNDDFVLWDSRPEYFFSFDVLSRLAEILQFNKCKTFLEREVERRRFDIECTRLGEITL